MTFFQKTFRPLAGSFQGVLLRIFGRSFAPKTVPVSREAGRSSGQPHVERRKGDLIIDLGGSRKSRLNVIRKAFENFYKIQDSRLQFILPRKLLDKCHSHEELRQAILPYQVDILSIELERHLSPYLHYQELGAGRRDHEPASQKLKEVFLKNRNGFFREYTARELNIMIRLAENKPPPQSVLDIAHWMEDELKARSNQQVSTIEIKCEDKIKSDILMTISAGHLMYQPERIGFLESGRNQNCFNVVKSPFYPPHFRRFSEGVEIHIHKEIDFATLTENEKKLILRDSDEVLAASGIIIERMPVCDVPAQVKEGVWIPQYRQ